MFFMSVIVSLRDKLISKNNLRNYEKYLWYKEYDEKNLPDYFIRLFYTLSPIMQFKTKIYILLN